jgi:drug/metabolite transporter superfamily protein YnfA
MGAGLLPAFLCAIALIAAALAVHPVAEIGMNDDWTYVQSARDLLRTGHIAYNGWAAAMVGWQLFTGALFAKLFGPSFTAIRSSTLMVAVATAILTQRCLIRAGLRAVNATLGTLALVLSPLFLPLALSFMTDIGSLFCIIACFYACLRALQARKNSAAAWWLTFAAIGNVAGGTVRQIAWLGVLVLFPSTVWILRRRKNILPIGILLYAVSLAGIVGCLRWFSLQPNSVSGPLMPVQTDGQHIHHLLVELASLFFDCAMFLLPILSSFFVSTTLRNRRSADLLILSGVACLLAALFLSLCHPHAFAALLAPYGGNYVSATGMVDGTPIQGTRPVILPLALRLSLTVAVIASLNCLGVYVWVNRKSIPSARTEAQLSWNHLLLLLAPFSVAYVALLVPHGLAGALFDRYSLPLLFIGIVILLRLYQDRSGKALPPVSVILISLFAIYAVAGTHDAFRLFRAKAAAIAELRAAGIPDSEIDGGFEHNAMTQIQIAGHIDVDRIRRPLGIRDSPVPAFPNGCEPFMELVTPVITPGYALSFNPVSCGGPSGFAAIPYYDWTEFQARNLYIVRTVRLTAAHR